jgi:hypothetical protein
MMKKNNNAKDTKKIAIKRMKTKLDIKFYEIKCRGMKLKQKNNKKILKSKQIQIGGYI